MDQTYVYEEDVEQGLTLKKVWQFIKQGWLYIVIGIAVAVVLATIVALPIKYFYESESMGTTSIEYLYDDAANGLNPNGGTLNADNIISPNVLSKAVEAANLDKVITDISELHDACRVEGVYPDRYYELVQAAANGDDKAAAELRNYTVIPTRYDIIISEPEELGLSEVQTKTLLDKIVAAYFEDFQSRFSVRNMFASNIYTLSKDSHKEYADIYDEYSASLKPVAEYVTALKTAAPSFTSTVNNTDFATLLFDINRLASDYENYNSYLLAHNLWKDKASASLMLTKTQASIQEKHDNLEKRKQM
ncbi:MAG: hypothetical protein K2M48_01685, partial [Clostridiales bacterium]|nr:hypothetical protein [Clostridiales bacterium]